MTSTQKRWEGPAEPAPGQSPSSDVPAKYRPAPLSTRHGSRLVWLLIATMLLLIILALVGLARARRTSGVGAGPRALESAWPVREFTLTDLETVGPRGRGVRAVKNDARSVHRAACRLAPAVHAASPERRCARHGAC